MHCEHDREAENDRHGERAERRGADARKRHRRAEDERKRRAECDGRLGDRTHGKPHRERQEEHERKLREDREFVSADPHAENASRDGGKRRKHQGERPRPAFRRADKHQVHQQDADGDNPLKLAAALDLLARQIL